MSKDLEKAQAAHDAKEPAERRDCRVCDGPEVCASCGYKHRPGRGGIDFMHEFVPITELCDECAAEEKAEQDADRERDDV